ncbi:hypothetical protein J7J26_00230 [Candidatus Micrarchaeota archaeon]|nr:hypothetical protein [Candidatus Micrarchaeota archaeon]
MNIKKEIKRTNTKDDSETELRTGYIPFPLNDVPVTERRKMDKRNALYDFTKTKSEE